MNNLVDDLAKFKASPSMSAEEMAQLIFLRSKLDPDAIRVAEASATPRKGNKRGRKKTEADKTAPMDAQKSEAVSV